jgi:hypothetical protein
MPRSASVVGLAKRGVIPRKQFYIKLFFFNTVMLGRCKLPTFPMGDQQRWHIFVLEPGQIDVNRKEIEAMLRRFWHASTPLFDDELNQTAHPLTSFPLKRNEHIRG